MTVTNTFFMLTLSESELLLWTIAEFWITTFLIKFDEKAWVVGTAATVVGASVVVVLVGGSVVVVVVVGSVVVVVVIGSALIIFAGDLVLCLR